ncbi:MAG: hypothetical protein RLZZ184_394 [Cyanobacteriota bacterium]
MSELREKLQQNLDEAEWEWLIPHVQKDVVILLSVQHWIDEQLLAKPTVDQVGEWNFYRNKRFNALIIEPYVLVKEIITPIS